MAVLTETKPNFGGYATRVGLKCADGRTIMAGAFEHQDKVRVPLVWRHIHDDMAQVLGHAILEHRDDGVYAYGYLNSTEKGQLAKELIEHGDIDKLSIHAKNLKQQGLDVLHGDIKEVSLVLAGSNPGAFIDNINLHHSDSDDMIIGEAIIYTDDDDTISVSHADEEDDETEETVEEVLESLTPKQRGVVNSLMSDALGGKDKDVEHADAGADVEELSEGETVQDVYDSLNPVQKDVVNGVLGQLLESEDAEEDSEKDSEASHSDDSEEESEAESDSEQSEEDEESNDESNEESAEESESSDESNSDSDESADSDSNAEEESASHSDSDSSQDDENDTEQSLNHQEGTNMPRNVFEQNGETVAAPSLSHDDLVDITKVAVRNGSFKEAFLEHAEAATYGIDGIDLLFPDAKALSTTPELIARQAEWVPKVLNATKHSPFAKIKSVVADLTAEEARAKGYIKGTEKKEEVIKLLRRTTSPTTVYKKQKLDRDDIIDIIDLDVVAWLKWEIRFMLNEEIARAILVGDGRTVENPDKIKDPEGAIDGTGIRSIAKDNDLYAHKVDLVANISSEALIDEVTRARTAYRGSGSPSFYTTDKILTDLLLLKDKMGRRLYGTDAELASALRVKEIVSVEVLEESVDVLGIVVNLVDYTVGANKGGELSFFEDFDIDFNQNKYLMETRISGALTKPKSAIVIRRQQGTVATATSPSFDGATNTITIPTSEGVDYLIDGDVVTGTQTISKDTEVTAEPAEGYYLEPNTTKSWTFTYTPGA